jgi:hypothetical protein
MTRLLQRSDHCVTADMDGERVMFDVDKGAYFSLNSVGAHVWDQLVEPCNIEGLVASICLTFDAEDEEAVRQELVGFVEKLLENGLLQDRVG